MNQEATYAFRLNGIVYIRGERGVNFYRARFKT
jgi:hypothetical protein